VIRRRQTYVQAAESLKAKGLLDDEQDQSWVILDRVHDEAFKAGMVKGIVLGGVLVLAVGGLGFWL
jgi:hypothetical protein